MPQEVALHEVEFTGTPGNIVAFYKPGGEEFAGLPTRLIAWGPCGEDGKFKCLVPETLCETVLVYEYDPPVAAHFEKYGHINTE